MLLCPETVKEIIFVALLGAALFAGERVHRAATEQAQERGLSAGSQQLCSGQ